MTDKPFTWDSSEPGADILLEAHHLITGPRQAEYSHPFDDYYKVKELFYAMTGIMLTVEQAILFMVCVKLARLSTNMEHGRWKRDTIVDAAGYLGCMSMAHEHIEEGMRKIKDEVNHSQAMRDDDL